MAETEFGDLNGFSKLCDVIRNKTSSIEWYCRQMEKSHDMEYVKVYTKGVRSACADIEAALKTWRAENGIQVQ